MRQRTDTPAARTQSAACGIVWANITEPPKFGTAPTFASNPTLCLVPLHLLGIAVASFQHKENLVRGMIDVYKRKRK